MYIAPPRLRLRSPFAPPVLLRRTSRPRRPNRWLLVVLVIVVSLVVAVRLGARLDVGWNVSFYQPTPPNLYQTTPPNPSDNKSCEPPSAGQCR